MRNPRVLIMRIGGSWAVRYYVDDALYSSEYEARLSVMYGSVRTTVRV